MANPRNTVLPQIEPLTEDDFHAVLLVCLGNLYRRHGQARVAEWLGVSKRHLRNIEAGTAPAPHRLFNMLCHDPEALDPIDREYGTRRVSRDAVCTSDPVASRMAALLAHIITIEHEHSDGGADATMNELLSLPVDDLRTIARVTAGWVERIDAYRHGKPKAVA